MLHSSATTLSMPIEYLAEKKWLITLRIEDIAQYGPSKLLKDTMLTSAAWPRFGGHRSSLSTPCTMRESSPGT